MLNLLQQVSQMAPLAQMGGNQGPKQGGKPDPASTLPPSSYDPHPQESEYIGQVMKLDEEINKKSAEREKLLRAASTFKPPEQDPTNGIRPGAAGAAILTALLLNTLKKNAGTYGLQGFVQGAQQAEGVRQQNRMGAFNQNLKATDTESQILADQINNLYRQQGNVISEGRYQQGRQDKLASDKAAELKYERQQEEIRGRQARQLFFSANSVAELNTILDTFQTDPDIAMYSPNPNQVKAKIQELVKHEADIANEKRIDDFNQGYRSAFANTATWGPTQQAEWEAKRKTIKDSGVPGERLDIIAKAGTQTNAAANRGLSADRFDWTKDVQQKYLDMAEARFKERVPPESQDIKTRRTSIVAADKAIQKARGDVQKHFAIGPRFSADPVKVQQNEEDYYRQAIKLVTSEMVELNNKKRLMGVPELTPEEFLQTYYPEVMQIQGAIKNSLPMGVNLKFNPAGTATVPINPLPTPQSGKPSKPAPKASNDFPWEPRKPKK